MPRKSQVPGGSVNRKSGSSVKAIDVLPSSREEDIKNKVLNDLAVNLGVPVSDLPGDLHDAVGEQVTASLAENVKDLARNYATSHVRATLMQQFDSTNVLDDRLKGALSGIQQVGQNPNARQIMDENARLLKMKLDSLTAVGFTDDQAFQIILTELAKPRR